MINDDRGDLEKDRFTSAKIFYIVKSNNIVIEKIEMFKENQ